MRERARQPKRMVDAAVPIKSMIIIGLRPRVSLNRPQKTLAGMLARLYALVRAPAHTPTASTSTHSLTMKGAIGKIMAITMGSVNCTPSRMRTPFHGKGGSSTGLREGNTIRRAPWSSDREDLRTSLENAANAALVVTHVAPAHPRDRECVHVL